MSKGHKTPLLSDLAKKTCMAAAMSDSILEFADDTEWRGTCSVSRFKWVRFPQSALREKTPHDVSPRDLSLLPPKHKWPCACFVFRSLRVRVPLVAQ